VVEGNTIRNCGTNAVPAAGINLSREYSPTVVNNTITDARGPGGYGCNNAIRSFDVQGRFIASGNNVSTYKVLSAGNGIQLAGTKLTQLTEGLCSVNGGAAVSSNRHVTPMFIEQDLSNADFWRAAGTPSAPGVRTFTSDTVEGYVTAGLTGGAGEVGALLPGKYYRVEVGALSANLHVYVRATTTGGGTELLTTAGSATFYSGDQDYPQVYMKAQAAGTHTFGHLVIMEIDADTADVILV
jgi:hypothetical protein